MKSNLFFDTSAIVKYYHDEAGSIWVKDTIDNIRSRAGQSKNEFFLFISELTVFEITSALAKKVRSGELQKSVFDSCVKTFLSHIDKGWYWVILFEREVSERTLGVLCEYASQYDIRTLDALQYVSFERLRQMGFSAQFVSADKKLASFIKKLGFSVIDPIEKEKG